MADEFQFDLVSPERRLASFAAEDVEIPATAGDMTVMAGHVSTVTTLRVGLLRAGTRTGRRSFIVTGGFIEITSTGVIALAERAVPIEEATHSLLDELVQEAEGLVEAALPEDKDLAVKNLADVVQLRASIELPH